MRSYHTLVELEYPLITRTLISYIEFVFLFILYNPYRGDWPLLIILMRRNA